MEPGMCSLVVRSEHLFPTRSQCFRRVQRTNPVLTVRVAPLATGVPELSGPTLLRMTASGLGRVKTTAEFCRSWFGDEIRSDEQFGRDFGALRPTRMSNGV
jgi:hypothetical protein